MLIAGASPAPDPTASDPPNPGTPTPVHTGLTRRPRVSWQWMVGAWRTGREVELTSASSRSFTVRLADPSEATFQLFGKSTQAPLVEEAISDLWIYRNGKALYRGRVMGSNDILDVTNHTSRFTCRDYRGVLAGNSIPSTAGASSPVYNVIPTKPQEDIVWDDLIALSQTQQGANWGITKGLWPTTGVTRAGILYQDGTRIWDAIRTLSQMVNGFVFDIDVDLKANLYYPTRGNDQGSVLDLGGTVSGVTRSFDIAQYANSVSLTGNHTTDYTVGPYTVNATAGNLNDPTLFPEGRWDVSLSDSTVYDLAAVQALATAKLAAFNQLKPSYQFTLAGGAWGGPEHIWVGDTVTYTIRSGRLDIRNETGQVTEIAIDVDQNDAETVRVTVGRPINTTTKTILELSRRIAQLGRS